jgi:hypothetical protein
LKIVTAEIELLAAEAQRLVDAAAGAGSRLRLTGSIAVQLRCPTHAAIARRARTIGDIDTVAYKRDATAIRRLFAELGYAEDKEVFILSEGARAIFEQPEKRVHVDVFFDRLDFCHVLELDGRLDLDPLTLPLAELLLSKLQIVKVNEKDLLDAAVLLLEHPLGESDAGAINLARIAELMSRDWGLSRTAGINLDKVMRIGEGNDRIGPSERARIAAQIDAIQRAIEAAPKPLAWRMRAKVGDRVKWYKDVEEVR